MGDIQELGRRPRHMMNNTIVSYGKQDNFFLLLALFSYSVFNSFFYVGNTGKSMLVEPHSPHQLEHATGTRDGSCLNPRAPETVPQYLTTYG